MFDLLNDLYENLNNLDDGLMFVNVNEESGLFDTDVFETEKNYGLEIEIPGYSKENVTLNMENEYLVVQVKQEISAKKKHFLRRENRNYKNKHNMKENTFDFERRYYVGRYENEDIQAEMKNGLLTVLLPKEAKKITDKKYINIR